MPSHVVSIRLSDNQLERLKRFARRAGKKQSEMAAQFIEEKMRETEFAHIDFRNDVTGRQAYMKGSRLKVWWVIKTGKLYGMDVKQTAEYFNRPTEWVQAAFNYYAAHEQEIEDAIEDHDSITFEDLKRILPSIEVIQINMREEAEESAA